MSIKNTLRKIAHNLGRKPAYDWYCALGLFGVALCAALALNVYAFIASLDDSATPAPAGEQGAVILKADAIAGAVKSIDKKDARSKAMPSAIQADPSK